MADHSRMLTEKLRAADGQHFAALRRLLPAAGIDTNTAVLANMFADGYDERIGADVDFCVVVTPGPCVFTFYLAERVVSENRTGGFFLHDLCDMTMTWEEVSFLRAPVLDAVADV